MEGLEKHRGWIVAFAGIGINLALGILYTWSIFKDAITASIERGGPGAFAWPLTSVNDPYAVCCIVFSFAMILAGKCQDSFGPRITAIMGGTLVVAVLAVGNASGRIVAGVLSDRIGRSLTLVIMLAAQAVLMFVSIPVLRAEDAALLTVLLATAIGFNYGTNLSLFPSFTKDLWGLKNFGLNYGIVFTVWGVGGFVLSRLSQMIKVATGSFDLCFALSGVMLLGARLKRIIAENGDQPLVDALERRSAHVRCTEMV